jgi:holo-[acyl-carrier protein] synthase
MPDVVSTEPADILSRIERNTGVKINVEDLADLVKVRTTGPDCLKVRVGVDAVGVERLEGVLGGREERQEKLFTAAELDYCRGKRRCYEHLAARFAAKEAVLKAFGTGLGRRMRWTDVEVVNDHRGRPEVRLSGAVASFAERHGLRDLDVSLTHTEGLALAHAVTLWDPRAAEAQGPRAARASSWVWKRRYRVRRPSDQVWTWGPRASTSTPSRPRSRT